MAELRRLVRQLQAQNSELSRRLGALEKNTRGAPASRSKPAAPQERGPLDLTAVRSSPATASAEAPPPLPEPRDTSNLSLDQRVRELEVGWAAQEHATRQIIRDTLTKTGPRINNYLSLSGVIETKAARTRDFNGPYKDSLALSTVELDFDVRLSPWLGGAVVLNYETGSSAVFPISQITTPGVDRFTVDRTHISIGDLTRFPIAARTGWEVLHFGTTTGVARLDTLSIGTPMTTEVFENRQVAAGLEFAWPTPPLAPPPPPVVVPVSQPLVVGPLVNKFAQSLGYVPLPQRVARPAPVTPPIDPSPFYGSFMVYKGNEIFAPSNKNTQDFNASVGYRTRGHCGRPYEELRWSLVCPWQLDVHVDYNTNVFESKFLRNGYLPFLNQIGRIPGVAASGKASFGPFAVVAEYNGAIDQATFFDGLGHLKTITPAAWQFSLAYQFDWNPWITEIGAQGSFISVAYSGSKDMAGVTSLIAGIPTRTGFVPQNRLMVTAGEWPMDGLKLAVEYSANWDYPVSQGGTGQVAHGIFGLVQLNF